MEAVFIIGIFLIGLGLGWLISAKMKPKSSGTLVVDTSDPDDGPYLFLELSTRPETIMKLPYATFKVDTSNYISQK